MNALDLDPGLDVDGCVVWNAHNTRVTVQVFVEGQLEDGSTAVPVRVGQDCLIHRNWFPHLETMVDMAKK